MIKNQKCIHEIRRQLPTHVVSSMVWLPYGLLAKTLRRQCTSYIILQIIIFSSILPRKPPSQVWIFVTFSYWIKYNSNLSLLLQRPLKVRFAILLVKPVKIPAVVRILLIRLRECVNCHNGGIIRQQNVGTTSTPRVSSFWSTSRIGTRDVKICMRTMTVD